MFSEFTWLDGTVLVLYFVAILFAGYCFRRKSGSVEGFTAANRGLSGWLTGLSILGTYVSSISFLALPGKAYGSDWNSFVFSLSLPFATILAIRYFLPFYRKSGYISAYEHFESRFGLWARTYTSFFYLLTQLARMGTVMYLMALPLNVLLGWDLYWIIVVTGISVTFYTFVGGIVAVIWTDAIQTVILVVSAMACALLMVTNMPGGLDEFTRIALENDKFSLGSFDLVLNESTFWIVFIYGIIINLQNFGIDQNYVQRYIASRSDAEARKSLWLGGLLYIPVSALFFFIGTALFAFYTASPDMLAEGYRDPMMADKVFPYYIVTALPAGVTGLLIAAVFAAAMSTVSTSLNSSATIILNDYYKRFVNQSASEENSMRALHITTVVWGILGTCIALAMTRVQSALDAWWTLAGILSGGILGLFLMGIIGRFVRNVPAALGVAVGVTLILWLSIPRLVPSGDINIHAYLIPVFGTFAILITGFATGYVFNKFRSGAS